MTIFYKLNIHGGEAVEWFRLAMLVGAFQKVNDNQLIPVRGLPRGRHERF